MEDLKLGQASGSIIQTFTLVVGTPQVIAPPNPKRTRLMISSDNVMVAFAGPGPSSVSATRGLLINNTQELFTATLEDFGSLLRQPWSAQCTAAGGGTLTVIDVELEKL